MYLPLAAIVVLVVIGRDALRRRLLSANRHWLAGLTLAIVWAFPATVFRVDSAHGHLAVRMNDVKTS
jgi:hypothetical protein